MKRAYIYAFVVAASAIAAGSSQAADPTVDRMIASQCAQCHGTDGRSAGGIEGLAGEANEIVEEMREMLRDSSPNDIMEHQAHGYTEAQIQRIANYYLSLR